MPSVYDALHVAHRIVHEDKATRLAASTEEQQFAYQSSDASKCDAFDAMTLQFGIDPTSESDPALLAALAPLKQTSSDASLFTCLELCCSCMFLGKAWRSQLPAHAYSCELQGNRSNLHCAAMGVRALLVAFQQLGASHSMTSEVTVSQRITQECTAFMRHSAQTLLHLHQSHVQALANARSSSVTPATEDSATFSCVASALPLLEAFAAACEPRLSMEHIERVMPHAILRAMHNQTLEKAQGRHFAQQLQDDGTD